MKITLCCAVLVAHAFLIAAPLAAPTIDRAKELKAYLQKEKPLFVQRENQRRNLLEDLDLLNSRQNKIREKIAVLTSHHQELSMSAENLSMEHQKQKKLETFEKRQLWLLFKLIYKVKRDGALRFVISGEDFSAFGNRFRVLYRALRSHSRLTQQLSLRGRRLQEGENRLAIAGDEIKMILSELTEQQGLLEDLLARKRLILRMLNQKQQYFQLAVKEYHGLSKQLNALFGNFESVRKRTEAAYPRLHSLLIPVEMGRIVKNFGKSVHPKFGTITYHKGLEIEARHNGPVFAVRAGSVEFEGWVKGLGNVIIIHHGGSFYSLSGHLFKSLKGKGDSVEKGEPIGYVGDTGDSEKPSLYFELREKSKAIDPLAYFSPEAMRNLL